MMGSAGVAITASASVTSSSVFTPVTRLPSTSRARAAVPVLISPPLAAISPLFVDQAPRTRRDSTPTPRCHGGRGCRLSGQVDLRGILRWAAGRLRVAGQGRQRDRHEAAVTLFT